MSLFCNNCKKEHNLDETPDTGECSCGGFLVENDQEKTGFDTLKHAIINAVSDGILKANLIKGTVTCGRN